MAEKGSKSQHLRVHSNTVKNELKLHASHRKRAGLWIGMVFQPLH
jgi:hypothetical protein